MKKGKTLASLICSVVLSLSLIVGATLALFTDSASVNIAVTSGQIDVSASIQNVVAYSGVMTSEDEYSSRQREGLSFSTGGSVSCDGSNLAITNMAAMDKVTFDVVVNNESNIVAKYQTVIVVENQQQNDLFDALDITIGGEKCTETSWMALQPGVDVTVPVSIELPLNSGVQGGSANLVCTVYAVQGNAYTQDPVAPGEQAKEYIEINSVQELKDFRDAVNSGAQYQGKTATTANVQLGANIDLANEAWTPIGPNADSANKFKGTFDGKGYKISNLYVEQSAGYHAAGLFGALNGTLKNLTIENATIINLSSGSATDNGTAVVAGSIYTTGSIKNVHVVNATVSGNRYVGGISGYVYGSITDCSVSNATITATPDDLAGSYDNGDKVGGIAGYFGAKNTYSISGNKVSNVTLKGYRDIGGIVGSGLSGTAFIKNNTVEGASITVDQETGFYGEKATNAGAIVGRYNSNESVDSSNTYSNVTIVEDVDHPSIATTWAEFKEKIATTQSGTIYLQAGNYTTDGLIEIKGGKDITVEVIGGKATVTKNHVNTHVFNVNDSKFTLQNFVIDGNQKNREGIFVRNNATVTLVNCQIKNTGGLDICIDEVSDAQHGLNTTSTVNLINTKVEDVAICASPASHYAPAVQDTYVKFYYDADSTVGYIQKQNVNVKPENIYINDNNQGGNGYYVASADAITNLIKNSTGNINVYLMDDVAGNAVVDQKAGVDVVINGLGHEFDGSIEIDGNARLNDDEKVEIKNVNFVSDETIDFIHQNSTAGDRRYPHNVTIDSCTFTATGEGDVVAIRWRQGNDLVVTNCQATGLHSLLWATGSTNITIDGVTIEDSKNGISVGNSTSVVINNTTIEATGEYGYGVRADASVATTLSMQNNNITAAAPILLRKASGAYVLTLSGNNALVATSQDAYQIIVTGTDFEEGVAMGKPGTSYVINGGDGYSIYAPTATAAANQSALNSSLSGGSTEIALNEGDYKLPSSFASGSNVTITGSGEDTVFDMTSATNVNGSSITFENLTIVGLNSNTMNGYGIQHTTGKVVYKNCTFVNAITNENTGSVEYIDCTFTGTYYITTYAVKSAKFINCTFDRTDSRAILVYSHGNNPCQVLVKDCTFKADAKGYTGAGAWTAAIEVDTTNIPTAGTTVTIENCTIDSNYSAIVRDKSAAGKANAVITVDGVPFNN